MIDVSEHWWVAVLIAAGVGALGGLMYELNLVRIRSNTGMIELLGRRGERHYDLGFLASMLIGGAAAVGFLFFLPPERVVTVVEEVPVDQAEDEGDNAAPGSVPVPVPVPVPAARAEESTREYDGIRLVAASLIVGTAGSSFLTAMADRLRKIVSDTKLTMLDDGVAGLSRQLGEARLSVAGDVDPATAQLLEASGRASQLLDITQSVRRSREE